MGVSYLFLNVLAFHCPDTLVMVSPYWLLVTPLPSIPFTICKDPGQDSPPFETKNHIFHLLGPHAPSFLGGDQVGLTVYSQASRSSWWEGAHPASRPPSPHILTRFSFPLWPSSGCEGQSPLLQKGAAKSPSVPLSTPGQCQQAHHSLFPLDLHRL